MNFSMLIWREPWLAPIVLNLHKVIATTQVETAGVTPDGKTLYYSPSFWKSLNPDERLGVQLHEMLHIANLHAARKGSRQHMLWNIACDMAINSQIQNSKYTLPKGAIDGENDTAENIYERLLQKSRRSSRGQQGAKKSIYSGFGGTSGGKSCPQPEKAGEPLLNGDLLERNADGSSAVPDADTLEAIESAGRLAGLGNSPLAKCFQPRAAKADWRVILQRYVKSALGDDLDYLSYEFDEFGICEDVLEKKPRAKICALVDESGSIEDKLYEQFLGELAKMTRFAKVFVSGFTDGTDLNAVPLEKYHRTMTGGTDVLPAYRQACKETFDCILVLTDGCLTFPITEPKPTIWVMPESHLRKREVIL